MGEPKTTEIVKKEYMEPEVLPERDEEYYEVGQWFWVKDKKRDWLGAVTSIGSNYVGLTGISYSIRVHNDDLESYLRKEDDPDAYIDKQIDYYRNEVNSLMGRVKELTKQLGLSKSHLLDSSGESEALVRVTSNLDAKTYSDKLVKAKEEELPDLFKKIEEANRGMASWMKAKMIPLEAQSSGMRSIIKSIDGRIFSVELYAGLTEEIDHFREGESAGQDEKIHLIQRRGYMDEECLMRYQTGGMEFEDLKSFNKWMSQKENFERILPFPKCIMAFQVRRKTKEREGRSLADFISIMAKEKADKKTFLYMRNGDNLYCLQTAIDFGEQLFPDMEKQVLGSEKLWAHNRSKEIITDAQYQGMIEDYEREMKEWEKRKESRIFGPRKTFEDYEPFNQSNVLFDDIKEKVEEEMEAHNRIGLVVQGLLDRSPVFNPHPQWTIWTTKGFEEALELIYDGTRALSAGEPPDFEAYRKECNSSIKEGSVTIGQHILWLEHEAKKEANRLASRGHSVSGYRDYPSLYAPYGNPGPGKLAKIMKATKTGKCTFAWLREKLSSYDNEMLRTTFTCHVDELFNVDAYKPGDFLRFFEDPRTRADYLQWAPILLEAEEYHAGNRKVEDPPPPKKLKKTYSGKIRYQLKKRRKELEGKTVILTRDIRMESGDVHEKGTKWVVTGGQSDTFNLQRHDKGAWIGEVAFHEFELAI